VNQVLGDGIMALFGAPIAHEDHAIRAWLRRPGDAGRHAGLYRGGAPRPRPRAAHPGGPQLGEVVVRAIGNDLHMDYSAVGQTTHLAARMEQLATPASIRQTAGDPAAGRGPGAGQRLGPIPVKGLTEPMEVFELVGASAVRRRLQAAVTRGLTRFVGRETRS